MKLCRCDMCERVDEIPCSSNPPPYGQPPEVPAQWASVAIARERVVQPAAPPNRHTMTVDAHMGQVDITAETDEQELPTHTVHAFTELHVCAACLERLVSHPNLSKRVAEDDARAEAQQVPVGLATAAAIPSMRFSMRRREQDDDE